MTGPARPNLGKTNLGKTGLDPRRHPGPPMQAFDSLPPELRRWIANAVLPWSPASCRRLWQHARRAGASVEDALARLDRAEDATLRQAGVPPGARRPTSR